jgi:hypothetical protein
MCLGLKTAGEAVWLFLAKLPRKDGVPGKSYY